MRRLAVARRAPTERRVVEQALGRRVTAGRAVRDQGIAVRSCGCAVGAWRRELPSALRAVAGRAASQERRVSPSASSHFQRARAAFDRNVCRASDARGASDSAAERASRAAARDSAGCSSACNATVTTHSGANSCVPAVPAATGETRGARVPVTTSACAPYLRAATRAQCKNAHRENR